MRVNDHDRADAATDCWWASVLVARLEPGAEVVHRMTAGRAVFVHLADGAASLDGEDMSTGDVAAITDRSELAIRAWQASEVVLVEVAIVPGDARDRADDAADVRTGHATGRPPEDSRPVRPPAWKGGHTTTGFGQA